jgi:hypothetical protein
MSPGEVNLLNLLSLGGLTRSPCPPGLGHANLSGNG